MREKKGCCLEVSMVGVIVRRSSFFVTTMFLFIFCMVGIRSMTLKMKLGSGLWLKQKFHGA